MGAAMLVEMLAMGLGAEMMVAVLLGVRMEVDRVVMMEAVVGEGRVVRKEVKAAMAKVAVEAMAVVEMVVTWVEVATAAERSGLVMAEVVRRVGIVVVVKVVGRVESMV